MKTLIVVMGLLSSTFVMAQCGKGCTEWEGVCACDQAAFKAEPVNAASDEAPRKGQIREWESGEIKADMPVSLVAADAKLDAEKAEADAEGKRNAGL